MSDPAAAAPSRPRNPYVGPRAFRPGELFFGREEETGGLLDTLLPGGVTLLYSPSGAGKTSLIQASVVPAMKRTGFQVCGGGTNSRFSALRVNLPPPDLPIKNRYVFSVVNGLVGHLLPARQVAGLTVDQALDLFERRGPGGTEVPAPAAGDDPDRDALPTVGAAGPGSRVRLQQLVVIDQLEEVLTLDPNDTAGRTEFFHQLGYALRRGQRWALLSMREDYIGGIDRFKRHFQNELRATYRIDLLDEQSAIRAVQLPAAERGVTFEDDAARQLVADLRRVRADGPAEMPVASPLPASRSRKGIGLTRRTLVRAASPAADAGGRPAAAPVPGQTAPVATVADHPTRSVPAGPAPAADEPVLYPYVEPVLLQVICDSLWRILSKRRDGVFERITAADLATVAPYDTTLSSYYRHVMREAARKDGATERATRDWVEQHLLTKQGLRRPTRTLPRVAEPQAVIEALQRRYLIRDDPRPGGVWYELAHDMLVQPIIADNRAWRLSNLPAWQVVADEWYRTGRPGDLLLQGLDLLEARSAGRRLDLTAAESSFLAESLRVADQDRKLRSLTLQRNSFRLLMLLSLFLNVWLIARLLTGG